MRCQLGRLRASKQRSAAACGDPDRWHNAPKRPARRKRRGAQVIDLTDLADLSGWPGRTRLIVRREPRHPGAQRSLFPSENFRYWGFLTDQPRSAVQLDRLMRSHADVENAVCRLNHSGLTRMPFTDWHANSAWAAMCMIGLAPLGWFQNACLDGGAAPRGPQTAPLGAVAPPRARVPHRQTRPFAPARTAPRRQSAPRHRPPPLTPQPTGPARRLPPAGQPRHAPSAAQRRLSATTGAIGSPATLPPTPQQPHTTKPGAKHTENTTNRILMNNQG